tara:strand:+ start:102 stop:275 length:174 start_codon:yes stop_codon:yes gene_type:complete
MVMVLRQDISHLRNYITFPNVTETKFVIREEVIIYRNNSGKIKNLASNARLNRYLRL